MGGECSHHCSHISPCSCIRWAKLPSITHPSQTLGRLQLYGREIDAFFIKETTKLFYIFTHGTDRYAINQPYVLTKIFLPLTIQKWSNPKKHPNRLFQTFFTPPLSPSLIHLSTRPSPPTPPPSPQTNISHILFVDCLLD